MFRCVATTDERQTPIPVADNPTRLTALLAMNRPLSLVPRPPRLRLGPADRGKPTTTDDDFSYVKERKNQNTAKNGNNGWTNYRRILRGRLKSRCRNQGRRRMCPAIKPISS